MIPLETNRRILTWFCVFPSAESDNRQKLYHVLFFSFVLGVNVVSFFVSACYFMAYKSVDLEQSLFAIVQMLGEFNMAYLVSITYLLRHKIVATYKNLAEIYKTYENEDLFKFLAQANQKSELMWSMFLYGLIRGGVYTMLISTIISIFVGWWLEGEYVTKYSYRAYRAILPWDQTTLIGYIGEIIYDFCLAFTFAIGGSFMLYFISLCQHHQAFKQMFEHSLTKLDNSSENNLRLLLCRLIRFHVATKKLFEESAEAFSIFILVQLMSSMLMLSGSIFQLDLQISQKSFDTSITILTIIVSISPLFLYCYYGKMATDSFKEMADCLYQSNWRSLPIELQKYTIFMMANAQRPLFYHGFGIVTLDLQAFTQFIKAVYTYYMLFKTLAK